MLNSFFLKFEFRLVKFELNSNFVYVPDFQWRQLSLGLYSHSAVAMPWCSDAGANETRPARGRRQYDSTSRRRHQLVMLSHTLDQRIWILKLISHSPSYPGGHTRTLRCSGWGGERRIKRKESSASAGSEQTGRMSISRWHWLPKSSMTSKLERGVGVRRGNQTPAASMAAASIDGRGGCDSRRQRTKR